MLWQNEKHYFQLMSQNIMHEFVTERLLNITVFKIYVAIAFYAHADTVRD